MKRDTSSCPDRSDEGRKEGKGKEEWRPEGPWPTADGYRLSLLTSIQTAEDVDLVDFFRKVYPEVMPPAEEPRSPAPDREGRRQEEDGCDD